MRRRALLAALLALPAVPLAGPLARALTPRASSPFAGSVLRLAPVQARLNAMYQAWITSLETQILWISGLDGTMRARPLYHSSLPEQSGEAISILVNQARVRAGQ